MKKIDIDSMLSNLDNYGENIDTNKGYCMGFSSNQCGEIFWFKLNREDKDQNRYSCFGSYYGSSSCLDSTVISYNDELVNRIYTNLDIYLHHENKQLFSLSYTPNQIENYIGETGIETYYDHHKVLFKNHEFEIGFSTRDLHRFPNHPVEISGCWIKKIN